LLDIFIECLHRPIVIDAGTAVTAGPAVTARIGGGGGSGGDGGGMTDAAAAATVVASIANLRANEAIT
jgi:hypothetical protein